MPRKAAIFIITVLLSTYLSGCKSEGGGSNDSGNIGESCYHPSSTTAAGSSGSALLFTLDPIVSSGNPILNVNTNDLDSMRSEFTLNNLGGRGVLEGRYVDVRNGLSCNNLYGSFSKNNRFQFSHDEPGFQEAMAYYYGDQIRELIDSTGYLDENPKRVIAHCMIYDNAYYQRRVDQFGEITEKVCLGDSEISPGHSYADDASVIIHELQHGMTINHYSPVYDFNHLMYDEAGALGEGISDFVYLIYQDGILENMSLGPDAIFDARTFSRWALGRFFGRNERAHRGAFRCPEYDSDFPNCGGYTGDASGFSSVNSTISYSYPDGLGWPYANNYSSFAPAYVKRIHSSNSDQEGIHNNGTIIRGALWDAYALIKQNHSGDTRTAQQLMIKALHEGLRHLPKPTATAVSPVSYTGLAASIVDWSTTVGFNTVDRDSLIQAFHERGLYNFNPLPNGWASVGPGTSATPGMKIMDNPNDLKRWLLFNGEDPARIPQTTRTGLNQRLDPNETVLVWFDIQNNSNLTAGGLQLSVHSLNPKVKFVSTERIWLNLGYLSNSDAEIHYSKINGSDIVTALSSSNSMYHVATGVTYFKTNPFFDDSPLTGMWINVDSSISSGETVSFEVKIKPSNGPEETLNFTTTIQ